jgi:hypothetical protein
MPLVGEYLSGFDVGSGEDNHFVVSHLLFVDDTLLFCNADHMKIEYLWAVFTWFEVFSGLKVNMGKSQKWSRWVRFQIWGFGGADGV